MKKCLLMAERTGAFSRPELDVLEGVLEDWTANPEQGCRFDEIQSGGVMAGFALWGRTPMTCRGYDIYWIVVDPSFQGKGFGKKLIALVEDQASQESPGCIIRLETSGKDEYRTQRAFYLGCGFIETGRIKDFYRDGDDLVTYVKTVTGKR